MNETLGRIHFWGSLVAMNGIFLPMLVQGLAGMNRRLYDGGRTYEFLRGFDGSLTGQAMPALLLAAVPFVFIVNFFWSLRRGRAAAGNPWGATTLEWTTGSPPPHDNFAVLPTVYRGAYEYSAPGGAADFTPQSQP